MTNTTASTPDGRAATAMARLAELPLITNDLPGIGGAIKARPEHFVVEELLPYAPCGEGEHVYVTFRRSGWNTADAARQIQKALGVSPADVGWGGRKDKTAVVVQTISLRCGVNASLADVERKLSDLPFEIVGIDRHRNKIKTGHVAANRFSIIVSDPLPEARPRAEAIAARLAETGVPNFYGPQRFGFGMQNLPRGFACLNAPRRGKPAAFMVSVVQSALFNIWLCDRIRAGNFRRLLAGDIVKKTDTGGMFVVEDPALEIGRFETGAIVYTGPIYGFKMKPALHMAGEQETALLEEFALTPQDFKPLRSPGSRREAILNVADLGLADTDAGLEFSFTLPAGAYATTVLREFTR